MPSIYYLENDPNDFFFLERAFQKFGRCVSLNWFRKSADLKDALENGGELPGAILLDIKLDGESGLDVLAWLRSQPEYETIPTFLISSGRVADEILAAMNASATAYFFKPFRLEGYQEIVTTLCEFLSAQRNGPAALAEAHLAEGPGFF